MAKLDNKRALEMAVKFATEHSPTGMAYRALTQSMNPGNSFTIQEGVSDTSTPSATGGSQDGTGGGSRGSVMKKLSPSKKSSPKKGRKMMNTGGTAMFTADGKEYTGPTHKMPDGSIHTGAKHTKASKVVTKSKPKAKARKKLAKGSKPDFLDMDNDGNTTEPMKTAVKQKRTKKTDGGRMKYRGGGLAKNEATLDATSNRATNSQISRGGGAALRGTKFKGVF